VKQLVAVGVGLTMLLIAAAPTLAAYAHHKKHHRHAHVAARESHWVFAAAKRTDPAPAKVCTYMGGPKSSLWSCR
jgi:hypothetical protein